MWRNSLHVSGFFYALRKPPAGRVGAYRIRPPTRPGIWGECVFLVFKHRFIVIQTRFKRHSNSSLRAVGEGRQGRQPSWPGTSNAYQANFAGVRRRLRPLPRQESWPGTSKARTKQTSPASGLCRGWEAGRVHQTRTKQTSPASVDAPRARKAPKRAAERFRGLGKCQNAPLNVSEGHQGRQPSWPGTSNVYPDRFAGVRRRPEGSESVKTRR